MSTGGRTELELGPFRIDATPGGIEGWRGDAHLFGATAADGVALVRDCGYDLDDGEATQLLARLEELNGGPVALVTMSPLLRHQARRAGWAAPLRDPLRRGAVPLPADLAEALTTLLPGAEISVGTPPRGVRAVTSALVSGSGPLREVQVDGWRFRVPAANDLLAENLARAAETAVAVEQRFGRALHRVRVAFDRSSHGLAHGAHSGEAHGNAGAIHLAVSHVGVAAHRAAEARRRHGAHADRPPTQGTTTRFDVRRMPTQVDTTMAHELWHIVEHDLVARNHRDGMELRRRIGRWFGVETLEHAISGRAPSAPPAWRQAHERLRTEVSAYATKNPVEATAELFEGWWLAPEPAGAFAAFGDAIDELLPSP